MPLRQALCKAPVGSAPYPTRAIPSPPSCFCRLRKRPLYFRSSAEIRSGFIKSYEGACPSGSARLALCGIRRRSRGSSPTIASLRCARHATNPSPAEPNPIVEAYEIGGKSLRRDLDVEPLEEFASAANGQHLRSDFLPTRFVESTTPDNRPHPRLYLSRQGLSITCMWRFEEDRFFSAMKLSQMPVCAHRARAPKRATSKAATPRRRIDPASAVPLRERVPAVA